MDLLINKNNLIPSSLTGNEYLCFYNLYLYLRVNISRLGFMFSCTTGSVSVCMLLGEYYFLYLSKEYSINGILKII